MKIYIFSDLLPDMAWIIPSFPEDIQVQYLPNLEEFAKHQTEECLVIYMHSYISGRLEPYIPNDFAGNFHDRYGKPLDAIVLCMSESNDRSVITAAISALPQDRVLKAFVENRSFARDSLIQMIERLRTLWNSRKLPVTLTKNSPPSHPTLTQPSNQSRIPQQNKNSPDLKSIVHATSIVLLKKDLENYCTQALKGVSFHRQRISLLRTEINKSNTVEEIRNLIKEQKQLFSPEANKRRSPNLDSIRRPLRRKLKVKSGYWGLLNRLELSLANTQKAEDDLLSAIENQLKK